MNDEDDTDQVNSQPNMPQLGKMMGPQVPSGGLPPDVSKFDPKSEALEHPLLSPEDILGGVVGAPLAKIAMGAGPAVEAGIGALGRAMPSVGNEVGAIGRDITPLLSSITKNNITPAVESISSNEAGRIFGQDAAKQALEKAATQPQLSTATSKLGASQYMQDVAKANAIAAKAARLRALRSKMGQ